MTLELYMLQDHLDLLRTVAHFSQRADWAVGFVFIQSELNLEHNLHLSRLAIQHELPLETRLAEK